MTAPHPSPPSETKIGRFSVLSELGRGGMGVVYLAEDATLHRQVALKVIRNDAALDSEHGRRFLREARAAAAVTHPNIAAVYEAGEADGRLFLAMEFIRGTSLRTRLLGGALPLEDALVIARGIASALAKAHASGIVHRDLKPENVILEGDGQPKVLDFGLAKQQALDPASPDSIGEAETQLTREGVFVGTPAYASPEQLRGGAVDHRSDLFSFGVVLYELLTGTRPFHGETHMDLAIAVSRDAAPAPSEKNPAVPQELDRIVALCLEKDPGARVGDAGTLVRALETLRLAERATGVIRTESAAVSALRALPSGLRDAPAQLRKNEIILLERVREFWIEGVLERTLAHELMLELAKDERPGAVDRGFDLVVERLDQDDRPLAPDIQVSTYFDRHQKALLILGEPGAGKTMTLLELTRTLLERAESNPGEPLPVVLSLSSYADPSVTIADWVAEQLSQAYRIPRRVGSEWVASDRLALMLDGLDEVGASVRDHCVRALNQFRVDHGLASIAVTCRRADYEAQETRLKLDAALHLRALDDARIDRYLEEAGPRLRELAEAMAREPELRDLARTPLMLSVMSFAYGPGESDSPRPTVVPASGEDRRLALFDRYADRMFKRRQGRVLWERARTVKALAWLARSMLARSESVLFLEQLQPSMLPSGWHRFLYFLATRAVLGALLAWTGSDPTSRIGMFLSVTLALSIVDFRLSQKPPGSQSTKLGALKYVTWLMLLFGALLAITFGTRAALQTDNRLYAGLLFGGIFAGGMVLGIPLSLVLASRRRRLALGSDIRTVEALSLRWKRFGVLSALFALLPSILFVALPWHSDAGAALWDAVTGRKLTDLRNGELRSATLAPDGKRVLATRADWTLLSFDVATLHATPSGEGGVNLTLVSWAPDSIARAAFAAAYDTSGRRVATIVGSAVSRRVQVLDGDSLALQMELMPPSTYSGAPTESVEFSPSGEALLARSTTNSWVYDRAGKVIAEFEGRASFATDAEYVIVTAHRELSVVRIETGAPVVKRSRSTADPTRAIDVDPKGTRIIELSSRGCLSTIDLPGTSGDSHGSVAEATPADAGGRTLPIATCSAATESSKKHLSVRFSPDGNRILVTADDAVLLLDGAGTLVKQLVPEGSGGGRAESASFGAEGTRVIAVLEESARIFSSEDGARLSDLRFGASSSLGDGGVEMSRDGATALTWSNGVDGRALAFAALCFGLVLAAAFSLQAGVRRIKTRPNQGIALTLQMSLGLTFGVFVVASSALLVMTRAHVFSEVTLVETLRGSAFVAVLFGLGYGGLDLLYHAILRAILALRGDFPLRSTRFLDGAVQQIFLRRVGGGYMFIHRLVLEYFATEAERRLLR